VVSRGSEFLSDRTVTVAVYGVGRILPKLPFREKLIMSRVSTQCFVYRVNLLAYMNIRYGLVARISRSHTVFFVAQLGPRRPGFNSPCRNHFCSSFVLLLYVVGSEMRPKRYNFSCQAFWLFGGWSKSGRRWPALAFLDLSRSQEISIALERSIKAFLEALSLSTTYSLFFEAKYSGFIFVIIFA
jgi:hypothetical protein